jgi:hypothetical protein
MSGKHVVQCDECKTIAWREVEWLKSLRSPEMKRKVLGREIRRRLRRRLAHIYALNQSFAQYDSEVYFNIYKINQVSAIVPSTASNEALTQNDLIQSYRSFLLKYLVGLEWHPGGVKKSSGR